MSKYAYSLDGERYHGEFDDEAAALAEVGQEVENECEDGDVRIVYIGKVVPAVDFLRKRNPHWIGERIEEDIECGLNDEIGWEDAIMELTKEQRGELGKLVVEWLCTNAHFACWGVTDVKEHSVTVGGEA